jgi:hypothetical protein
MDIGSDDPVPNLKSGNSPRLGRRRAPFRGVPAAEEAVYGKASQTFHLLVDGSRQVREDYIQFVVCGVGRLIA